MFREPQSHYLRIEKLKLSGLVYQTKIQYNILLCSPSILCEANTKKREKENLKKRQKNKCAWRFLIFKKLVPSRAAFQNRDWVQKKQWLKGNHRWQPSLLPCGRRWRYLEGQTSFLQQFAACRHGFLQGSGLGYYYCSFTSAAVWFNTRWV